MNTFDSFLNEREQTAVEQFIEQLRHEQGDQLQGTVLYGSKARGNADPESDIDLLLIMAKDDWSLRNAVSKIASGISLDYDVSLSAHLVSLKRWYQMEIAPFSFFENIFHECIPFFGSERLFAPLAASKTASRLSEKEFLYTDYTDKKAKNQCLSAKSVYKINKIRLLQQAARGLS